MQSFDRNAAGKKKVKMWRIGSQQEEVGRMEDDAGGGVSQSAFRI